MILGVKLFGKKVYKKWTIKKGAWRKGEGRRRRLDGCCGLCKIDPGKELQIGDGALLARIKKNQNNHCPTNEGMSAAECASEASSAKRVVQSKQTSERCKQTSKWCEGTSERKSKWPSTQNCIVGYSGPQCGGEFFSP